ncbi:Ankyrin-2 [Cichlidogyrus casuarinus]|uniref:Ankyrin-2 n=1 Tax=Cichlidogyrus casuarinus TaxID=1844966 RepID=A0ABD2QEN6_9PLAT
MHWNGLEASRDGRAGEGRRFQNGFSARLLDYTHLPPSPYLTMVRGRAGDSSVSDHPETVSEVPHYGEESMLMMESRDLIDVASSRKSHTEESIKFDLDLFSVIMPFIQQHDGVPAVIDWLGESDNVEIVRQPVASGFLASFVVDARGALLQAQRKQQMRFFIPPNSINGPTRVIARLCRQAGSILPPLNDGDGLACRVIEVGPPGVKFTSPILIEVPHCASLVNRTREVVVLRSDNGTAWKEHVTESNDQAVKDSLADFFNNVTPSAELAKRRIHRIMTYDLPRYFALVSRIRQEMILIGPEGGVLSSSVVPQVQAMFPQGALTKNIRVGLEAHSIDPELVTKVFGPRVSVSPVVTVEPRRRKFHKAITLTMPLPKDTLLSSVGKKDSSRSIADTPSLRLLCSIMGGVTPAKWEDITGSSTMNFGKGCVSFTTTVSAR